MRDQKMMLASSSRYHIKTHFTSRQYRNWETKVCLSVFQYGELGSSKVKGDQRFCKTEERDNRGVKIRLDPYYQGRSCRHIETHC